MQNINIFNSVVNKLPPQNILLEEVILSSLLVDNINTYQIMTLIKSDDFALESHRIIYKSIIRIYKECNYVNLVHFIYLLWEKKLLKQIGGIKKVKYLVQLSQHYIIYSDKNRFSYIAECLNLLRCCYIKRLIIQHSYNLINLSYIPNISTELLYEKTIKYFEELNKIFNQNNKSDLNFLIGKFLQSFELNHTQNNLDRPRILSGFYELDSITNGLSKGDLVVIAGRPSTGKTSMAVNIVKHLIYQLNIGIYIFSLEMSKMQILYKIIAIVSKIPMQNILKGCLTNCEWIDVQNICKKLNLSTLYIDDEANVSIDYISSQIKAITQKQQKSFLIIIDYLQLIQYNLNNRGTRAQELTQITRQLKLLAKKFNYPFIILSQLNRNIENRINKRPLLSDLRESGCINIHSIIYNHVLYKVVNIRKKKLAILSP